MSQIIRWTISASFYHLQKCPENLSEKVNWIRLFVSFQWKISGSDETSVFQDRMFQTESFICLNPSLRPVSNVVFLPRRTILIKESNKIPLYHGSGATFETKSCYCCVALACEQALSFLGKGWKIASVHGSSSIWFQTSPSYCRAELNA